jgi:DNA-directed RNA polymerase subunit RPC12/RpoP
VSKTPLSDAPRRLNVNTTAGGCGPMFHGARKCTKCLKIYDIDQFYKSKRHCRKCRLAVRKAWEKKYPEKHKLAYQRQNIKRRNMTLEQKEIILKSQSYKCAICKTTNPPRNIWHIDHCHRTKKNRGILCSNCNTGLGLFKDSVQNLSNALRYLIHYEQNN